MSYTDHDHVSVWLKTWPHRSYFPLRLLSRFSKWIPPGHLLDVLIPPDLVICQCPICNLYPIQYCWTEQARTRDRIPRPGQQWRTWPHSSRFMDYPRPPGYPNTCLDDFWKFGDIAPGNTQIRSCLSQFMLVDHVGYSISQCIHSWFSIISFMEYTIAVYS